MNKKNQLELEKDKDYEIIDGKEGLWREEWIVGDNY